MATKQNSGGEADERLIPVSLGAGKPSITSIRVGGKLIKPDPEGAIPLKRGSKVVLGGERLSVYDHVNFLDESRGISLARPLAESDKSGTSLSFEVPNFDNEIREGGFFWLKLLSQDHSVEVVIGPHLVYSTKGENDEQFENTKLDIRQGAPGAGNGPAGGGTAGPVSVVVGAGGAVIGGIAEAVAGGQAGKTSPAANQGAAGISTKSGTAVKAAGGQSDNDADDFSEQEISGQETLTSTNQVSTGGQTISQGGTVTAQTAKEVTSSGTAGVTGQFSGGGGTAESTATIKSGGTTRQNISVEGTAGTSARGSVSSKVSGTVQASGQSTLEATAAAKTTGTAKQESTVKTSEARTTEGQAETKVKGEQATEKKVEGETKSELQSTLSQSGTVSERGTSFGGSTATVGLGFKPPASLGTMKKLEVDLSSRLSDQNITGNLPTKSTSTASVGLTDEESISAQVKEKPDQETKPKEEPANEVSEPTPPAEIEPEPENAQPQSPESPLGQQETGKEPQTEKPTPDEPVKPRETQKKRPDENGPVLGGPERFPAVMRPAERGQPGPGAALGSQPVRPFDGVARPRPEGPADEGQNLETSAGEPKDAQIGQPLQMGDERETEDEGAGQPRPPGQTQEAKEAEEEQNAEQEAEPEQQLLVGAQQTAKSGVKGYDIAEAEKIANEAVNKFLVATAWSLWATVVGIVLGAVLGDILWLLKDWLVKKVLTSNPLLNQIKGLKLEDIKIKFSLQVKAHIIAMNLAVLLALGIIFITVVALLWGVCNSTLLYPIRAGLGINSLCESLSSSSVGAVMNSIAPSGNFQPSNNPGTLTGTAQWTAAINASAQKSNIDACILRVVVQKESGGTANAIGCDCAANGNPGFCKDSSKVYYPGYQFNWAQCSYGIGLTQWTIFPQGSKGFAAWQSDFLPSRNVVNNWYGIQDFLNPNTSLDLTAQVFSANLAKANGDVATAFGNYVGVSSSQSQLVSDRMALYNLCKSSQ